MQLDRAATADAVAARLRAELGAAFEVRHLRRALPMLKTMEKLSRQRSWWLIALFVYLLVGLGILNTMLMSVLERTREFGVMRALGTRPGGVVALVLGRVVLDRHAERGGRAGRWA